MCIVTCAENVSNLLLNAEVPITQPSKWALAQLLYTSRCMVVITTHYKKILGCFHQGWIACAANQSIPGSVMSGHSELCPDSLMRNCLFTGHCREHCTHCMEPVLFHSSYIPGSKLIGLHNLHSTHEKRRKVLTILFSPKIWG